MVRIREDAHTQKALGQSRPEGYFGINNRNAGGRAAPGSEAPQEPTSPDRHSMQERNFSIDGKLVSLADAMKAHKPDNEYKQTLKNTLNLSPGLPLSKSVPILDRRSTGNLPDLDRRSNCETPYQRRSNGGAPYNGRHRRPSIQGSALAALQPGYEALPPVRDPRCFAPDGEGARYCYKEGMRGLADQRVPLQSSASLILHGYVQVPHNERLQRAMRTATTLFKYNEPVRWSSWPFEPRPPQTIERWGNIYRKQPLKPPDQVVELTKVLCETRSVTATWLKNERRHANDVVDGYELQFAEMSVLDDRLSAWQTVQSGPENVGKVGGLQPRTDVHLRVRAFNAAGVGPWSDVLIMTTEEERKKELQEIQEIPDSWRTIELDDLLKTDDGGREWERLLVVLQRHRAAIKIVNRYYSLVGASSRGDDHPGTMNMSQFLAFVKGVGLKGKEPISDIDRIFLRSIRQTFGKDEPSPGSEAAGVSPLFAKVTDADACDIVGGGAAESGDASAARDSKWRKAKKAVAVSAAIGKSAQKKAGNAMHQHQFVAALIRLSAMKGSPGMWLSQRLDMICKESIAPHVYEDLKLVNDAFSEFMSERRMVAVLHKHCKVLTGIFDFYADTDTDWDARFTKSTMNISELTGLCEDVEMFNQRFAIRNMVRAKPAPFRNSFLSVCSHSPRMTTDLYVSSASAGKIKHSFCVECLDLRDTSCQLNEHA